MKFQELVTQLGTAANCNSLSQHQHLNPEVETVTAIDRAESKSLSYIEGGKFASEIATTRATALILAMDETLQTQASKRNIAWIATPDPRLAVCTSDRTILSTL